MECKICGNDSQKIFNEKVLNKYKVDYFHCPNCGFIYTEDPFWIQESYQEAITSADTGVMVRNLQLVSLASSVIFYLFEKDKSFLDYGGGYGIFTRMMRDVGFDFYWHDLYCENLLAKEFSYTNQSIELLTCFEVFEHFCNPIAEIEKMLSISSNILFSTEIYDGKVPEPNEWWYYCFDTGQHISFFAKETLIYIANKYNLNFYSNNNIHLITDKKINGNTFGEIIDNYDSEYKKIKNRMISRTFSDMNNINLRNNKIDYINNLKFDIYNFIDIVKDKNIIIFGTGSLAQKLVQLLRLKNIKIQCLTDNNSDKWGKVIYGLKVIEPRELKDLKENTVIIIGSSYYLEISDQLNNMGIEDAYYIQGF